MGSQNGSLDVASALKLVDAAVQQGKLTAGASENLKAWLTENRYEAYRSGVLEHIQSEKWQKLDDVFWTVIPFGTGGRRGRMYAFGSNAINDRTIGESAQGLANYINELEKGKKNLRCAIAYDTRHNSRHFAELCASIMVANGFEVFFLEDYRATPQLSFAVRYKQCDCGIMVTASHNPPSDNAVKVYQSTGGQVLPPHDEAIIERVLRVDEIKTVPFEKALAEGKVIYCKDEVDKAYFEAVLPYAFPGPRDVKIIYSPLHGVGGVAALPLLKAAGFEQVEQFAPHAEPNGDFPNVPGHVSNPENAAVFDAIIEAAKKTSADLILATDPDCDRMGAAAPLTQEPGSDWGTINGNQLGALLTDYVLRYRKRTGTLKANSYVIKTLVTTELIRRIAVSYGARCEGNIHVGFKWIAGLMDDLGPDGFEFGTEESHGFLIGTYARDKDGAVACLLMSLLAAELKQEGKTLHQRLDELQRQHGVHLESVLNLQMEGSEGMVLMKRLMAAFRDKTPVQLGGIDVASVRDYGNLTVRNASGKTEPLNARKANMVVLDLAEEGNYVAVRPSGTEPKVKLYLFSRLAPDQSFDVAAAQQILANRIARIKADVQAFSKQVTA